MDARDGTEQRRGKGAGEVRQDGSQVGDPWLDLTVAGNQRPGESAPLASERAGEGTQRTEAGPGLGESASLPDLGCWGWHCAVIS